MFIEEIAKQALTRWILKACNEGSAAILITEKKNKIIFKVLDNEIRGHKPRIVYDEYKEIENES